MYKVKTVAIVLRFIVSLIISRPFGNILHDIAEKYDLLRLINVLAF